jgi:hypothetical protein
MARREGRYTGEMNASKIDTVDVDQTPPGRILNFDTVTIKGTGTTIEPINQVDRPLELRNASRQAEEASYD